MEQQKPKFQMGEIVKISRRGLGKITDVYIGKNGPEYEISVASDGSEDWVLEWLLKKLN